MKNHEELGQSLLHWKGANVKYQGNKVDVFGKFDAYKISAEA